jgi:uncharacterized protein YkwD
MFHHLADRPARSGWLALGALALLLSCPPGKLRPEDAPAAREREELAPDVRRVVTALINGGADQYNGGDPEGCCRLYESGLRVLRAALAGRPRLQRAIDDGLADAARKADSRDRAFALRAVLDAVKAGVGARKAEAPTAAAGFTLSREEKALLALTNAERKKAGQPALRPSERLFQAARAHSANMARQEVLAHTLDGEGPGERIRKAGYRATAWGENCAAGQPTPEEAISSWMNSEGHRKNLLGSQYTEVGLGVAVSSGGTPYYTQVFATPAE